MPLGTWQKRIRGRVSGLKNEAPDNVCHLQSLRPNSLGTRRGSSPMYQVELEASNHNDGTDSPVSPAVYRKARAAGVTNSRIFTVVIEP